MKVAIVEMNANHIADCLAKVFCGGFCEVSGLVPFSFPGRFDLYPDATFLRPDASKEDAVAVVDQFV